MNLPSALKAIPAKALGLAKAVPSVFAKTAARLKAAPRAGKAFAALAGDASEAPPSGGKRGLSPATIAAIVAVSAVSVVALLVAARAGKRGVEPIAERFANVEFVRMLALPGPAPGETPFPLAFERTTRYTEEDAARYRPDLSAIDLEEFARNRKAKLEAVFDALD